MLIYERGLHPFHSHCYKSSLPFCCIDIRLNPLLSCENIFYGLSSLLKSSDLFSFNASDLVFYDEFLISRHRSVNIQINESFMIICKIMAIRHL